LSTIKSSSEGYRSNCYVHTQAGRFYASNPTWDVSAIAHALGQTARYRGNADTFYSVAEHSVLVSLLVSDYLKRPEDAFEALHHDDTESVLPDVSAPFKQLFPDLRAVDKHFEQTIREHFSLPASKSNAVAKADWLALFIEAAQILPGRGTDFEDPYNFREEAMDLRERGWKIGCYGWKTAKAMYLQRHQELGGTL
jgi:5'-deoxynucleotidase YfbR-like HD superfamily hydrolase